MPSRARKSTGQPDRADAASPTRQPPATPAAIPSARPVASSPLRAGQRLGKYRIRSRLGRGAFATVYRAHDTIEGMDVALKIPQQAFVRKELIELFRREVRLTVRLDHPNILNIKNASFIDERFVVVLPVGTGTLADRITRRLSVELALSYAEQLLAGLAHAHREGVIHCDVKPDNLILFAGGRLRLSDFGIAKVAAKTVHAHGSGTIGYVAPEQALGRPSPRSDVFSAGLIVYRMLSGRLPEWPYAWPPPGFDRMRRRLPPTFLAFLQRAIEVDDKRRYVDAEAMLRAFERQKPRALAHATRKARARRAEPATSRDWRSLRQSDFQRRFGKLLGTRASCHRCSGAVSEAMRHCPWCGVERRRHGTATRFPARCGRCQRGRKLDWKYCAWCWGPGFTDTASRHYADRQYLAKCRNGACRGELMSFMCYCPWCRQKVRQRWPIEGAGKCGECGSGFVEDYWSVCPWCGHRPPAATGQTERQ